MKKSSGCGLLREARMAIMVNQTACGYDITATNSEKPPLCHIIGQRWTTFAEKKRWVIGGKTRVTTDCGVS